MVGLLVLKMDRFGTEIDAGMVEYLQAAGNGFDEWEDLPPSSVLCRVGYILHFRGGNNRFAHGNSIFRYLYPESCY
jgi:hypothetical protein